MLNTVLAIDDSEIDLLFACIERERSGAAHPLAVAWLPAHGVEIAQFSQLTK